MNMILLLVSPFASKVSW